MAQICTRARMYARPRIRTHVGARMTHTRALRVRSRLFVYSGFIFFCQPKATPEIISKNSLRQLGESGRVSAMKTKNQWAVSDISGAKFLGTFEVPHGGEFAEFEVLETPTRLVFGGTCNVGFLESGFIVREDGESLDDTLRELMADLDVRFNESADAVSRIICNDRM